MRSLQSTILLQEARLQASNARIVQQEDKLRQLEQQIKEMQEKTGEAFDGKEDSRRSSYVSNTSSSLHHGKSLYSEMACCVC